MLRNMKDIKVNLSKSKEDFRLVLEAIIASGFDVWLTNNQSEIRVYLKEPGRDIVLNINGAWHVE